MNSDAVELRQTLAAGEPVGRLSFEWLYGRVSAYVDKTSSESTSLTERWATWLAFASAGVGLLATMLSPVVLAPAVALDIMKVALACECLGAAVAAVRMLWRLVPHWRRLRANHAAEMDREFGLWRDLVSEIRGFPRPQREQMLSFAKQLREGMTYRLGLALGGVERLGVFPILVALYLQFRGWKFGDWAAAFDVHLVGGLLIWAIALLYVMGWALVGLRVRLSTYIDLLEESIAD
ncbi:hypothetical protein [Lysobacter claricitrinus]|uniref:hypothetical protein n=1 Tax=Lysobacter claricitrinus TaxID=3367728 RepID=UPI0037DA9E27